MLSMPCQAIYLRGFVLFDRSFQVSTIPSTVGPIMQLVVRQTLRNECRSLFPYEALNSAACVCLISGRRWCAFPRANRGRFTRNIPFVFRCNLFFVCLLEADRTSFFLSIFTSAYRESWVRTCVFARRLVVCVLETRAAKRCFSSVCTTSSRYSDGTAWVLASSCRSVSWASSRSSRGSCFMCCSPSSSTSFLPSRRNWLPPIRVNLF